MTQDDERGAFRRALYRTFFDHDDDEKKSHIRSFCAWTEPLVCRSNSAQKGGAVCPATDGTRRKEEGGWGDIASPKTSYHKDVIPLHGRWSCLSELPVIPPADGSTPNYAARGLALLPGEDEIEPGPYSAQQPHELFLLARRLAATYKLNPNLTFNDLFGTVSAWGAGRVEAWKALALAALDKMYPSNMYKHDKGRNFNVQIRAARERMVVALLSVGNIEQAVKSAFAGKKYVYIKQQNALYFALRSADLGELHDDKMTNSQRNLALRDPKVSDALVEQVLDEIKFEQNAEMRMRATRQGLAVKLYVNATSLWGKVMELAGIDPSGQALPNHKIEDKALRAVVEAAHHAIHDAQLLSGQATDRSEAFVKSLNAMTDEQLIAFITEGPALRPLPERDDAKIIEAEYKEQP